MSLCVAIIAMHHFTQNDYRFYLDKLKQASEKHQCDLHAYVLMTNHLYLLMTTHKREALGETLQTIGRYYVQYLILLMAYRHFV